MWKLTFSVRRRGQPVQTVRHGHRARLQHLFVEVLLFQRGEVGFEFVFVDGFGDGHRGDGVADLLGQFVLFAELFPVIMGISIGPLTGGLWKNDGEVDETRRTLLYLRPPWSFCRGFASSRRRRSS